MLICLSDLDFNSCKCVTYFPLSPELQDNKKDCDHSKHKSRLNKQFNMAVFAYKLGHLTQTNAKHDQSVLRNKGPSLNLSLRHALLWP